MNNPPAFQFYPEAFLADLNVMSMTDKEVGRYIKLLCMCWIEDGLPVKGGSRVVDKWFNESPTVKKCFIEKDGKYRNPRLDQEREKQIKWREKSSLGGRKSVETKRLHKGGSRVVQPKVKPLSLSLPSISNKKKSKKISSVSPELFLAFEKWWKRYPRKLGKQDALKLWLAIAEKEGPEIIEKALTGYVRDLNNNQTEERFILHPPTFLRNDRWRDYLGLAPQFRVGQDNRTAEEKDRDQKLEGEYNQAANAFMAKHGYTSLEDIPFDSFETLTEFKLRRIREMRDQGLERRTS
jgi:hypothetical protein